MYNHMFNGAHSKLTGLVISLFALATMPLISEASNQAPKFWLPEGYEPSEWPNSCNDLFPARPWLRDDLDDWIARSKVSLVPTIHCPVFGFLVTIFLVDCSSSFQGPPHNLAVIFVDNSGVDIILGMFPFIRELLLRGTKVKFPS